LTTPHGAVETPAFLPVGTLGAVKTLSPGDLRACGVEMALGNTYHLHHQPGEDIIAGMGGLARFMSWDGPTLTDSGGFQVFSLSDTRQVSEEGVVFSSVYDGADVHFTPESVCRIQRKIGADLIYALDECPPWLATESEVERATMLSVRWARRFFAEFAKLNEVEGDSRQTPVPVIQGGRYRRIRKICIDELASLNPLSYGVGGVSVGEPPEEMIETAALCCELLPPEKPRHLLGVGTPLDILNAIEAGVDLFDCVLPTRNGRNGQVFTSHGVVNLRLARWRGSAEPLDEACSCEACRNFTRGYLHHLTVVGETLGLRLLSLHNVAFYQRLVAYARESLTQGTFTSFKRGTTEALLSLE